MSNRGKFIVVGTNVNVAGTPKLYPAGYDNHTKHCLVFNAIANGGKSEDGQTEYKTTMPIKIWGPYALAMAQVLRIGSPLVVEGRLSSYLKPTGQVVNGKPDYKNIITITATEVQVIGESKKSLNELIAKNVLGMVQTGVVRQEQMGVLTGDNLIKHDVVNMVKEFDSASAMRTGKFGNAEVWTKDRGNWGANLNMVASASPAGTPAGIDPATFTQFLQFQAAMKAHQAATVATAPIEMPADTEIVGIEDMAMVANAEPVISAFD